MNARMAEGLALARLQGRLVRYPPYGLWSYPGCPTTAGTPKAYVTPAIVRELVACGYLRFVGDDAAELLREA